MKLQITVIILGLLSAVWNPVMRLELHVTNPMKKPWYDQTPEANKNVEIIYNLSQNVENKDTKPVFSRVKEEKHN